MRIFLIGFMGAGKTPLGKELAALLGYEFIDTDSLFEEQYNTSIINFFADKGEEAFRQGETAVLKSLQQKNNIVVATGGGMPCFYDNMQWMNENGITIYIVQEAKELISRLQGQKNHRPIVQGTPTSDMPAFITYLLSKREPFYKQAKFSVLGPVVSAQTVINTINTDCA